MSKADYPDESYSAPTAGQDLLSGSAYRQGNVLTVRKSLTQRRSNASTAENSCMEAVLRPVPVFRLEQFKNLSLNKIEGMMPCTVIRCKGRKIRRCLGASSFFLMEADDYCTQIRPKK